jgi:dipeptidyl aminopeptidase/acylaminoacyl peptidase
MKSITTIFGLLFSILVYAQEITLEEIMDYSFPTSLTASESEDYVTWVENRNGIRNVYYAKGPGYEPKKLTQYAEDDGQDIGNLVFTEDHQSIVFVRGGAPNRRGEYPNPTSNPAGYKQEIYIAALDTGFPRLIDEGSSPLVRDTTVIYLKQGTVWQVSLNGGDPVKLFEVRGGVSSLRLSPDQSKLAFVNGRGDHSFIGVYDLNSGGLSFMSPSIDEDSNPVWSPDGKKLAFLRTPHESPQIFVPLRSSLPFSIWVADVSTGTSKQVWKAEEGLGSAFRFISALNQIFWTADDYIIFPWERDGWTHLYAIDAVGGKAQLLTPGDFEVQFVSIASDQRTILYSSNQDDINRQHIWQVVPGQSPKQLTKGEGIEWAPVMDGTGNIFMLGSTGIQPAGVQRIDGSKSVNLSDPIDYPSDQLVEPKGIVFTASDGMKIHGQLFLPKDLSKADRRPAVLFFHGGSRRQMLLGFHHRGYYHHAYAMNQYLASRGYVVLSVNYRSGIGYGMEFREAINYGAGGASEFNDVLGAGLFLQNHPNVDAERIGLWGGSYGGYLTALGLSRASDLFKAGVDIHGVYDWNAVIKNFIPSYNKLEDPAFTKLAYDSSPIASMDTWKSPVLLIHGDDDRNVPFSETVNKAEALRKQGVYFEQLIFPDEVHGFLLHSNWLKAYEGTADFFDRMLKN